MKLNYRELRMGDCRHLAGIPERLDLVLGQGRAVSAAVDAGLSVWLALTGRLYLESEGGQLVLEPGQMQVWTEGRIQVRGCSNGLWLALAGQGDAWRACPAMGNGVALDPLLYPVQSECPKMLRRLFARLAGLCRRGADRERIGLLCDALVVGILETQSPIEALVMRCSGHTYARKRQNLVRLLRVRNHIWMHPDRPAKLSALAEVANYSRWHLVRAFRDVFGEAPVEYANRIRMEYARRMIEDNLLSVSQVADMVGYDSRSAFCRSFRDAFGITAGQARRQGRHGGRAGKGSVGQGTRAARPLSRGDRIRSIGASDMWR